MVESKRQRNKNKNINTLFTVCTQPTRKIETRGSKVFRIAALRHVSTDGLLEVVESFIDEVLLQTQLSCQPLYSLLTWFIQQHAWVILCQFTSIKKQKLQNMLQGFNSTNMNAQHH